MTAVNEPTQAERLEIIAHLDGLGSPWSIDDVVGQYDDFVAWLAKDFPDDEEPTFTVWLAASGWME